MKTNLFAIIFGALLFLISPFAFATAPDFSTIITAVDFSTVISSLTSIFSSLAGVFVIMRGGALIVSKIRG